MRIVKLSLLSHLGQWGAAAGLGHARDTIICGSESHEPVRGGVGRGGALASRRWVWGGEIGSVEGPAMPRVRYWVAGLLLGALSALVPSAAGASFHDPMCCAGGCPCNAES